MFDKKIIGLNILFFAIIIEITIYHYLSHFNNLQKEILSYIELQAKSIAKRVEIAASNVYRSHKFVKKIIAASLQSQARLIDILDSIEPFKIQELKDFAEEIGLDIVCIINKKKSLCNKSNIFLNYKSEGIKFLHDKNLIIYIFKGTYSDSTIITGIVAKEFFKKQKKLSLNALISKIVNQREDIEDIKILKAKINKINIKLLNKKFYVVKVPFEAEKDKIVQIKINAQHLLNILDNFKHNLYVFIFVLILIGITGNLFLFIVQKKYLNKIRAYEKQIAINEKFSAIGRSAGVIAHEIRNPLNAIGIGLQRILYETDIGEKEEYKNLLETILKELKSINDKITTFIDYTRPIKLNKKRENLKKLIENSLIFYKNLNLKIELSIASDLTANIDKELFSQVISNLIRNAFENKTSTYLKISGYKKDSEVILTFENDGINEEIDKEKIFEPYFTTKTTGSGLGLAIAKKIVESHCGEISCDKFSDRIKFIIKLPGE